MKALVAQSYGPLDELTISELPMPVIEPGTILVRVEAAALNGADAKLPTGALRSMISLRFPFVPGMDAAGIVESVGPGVTRVTPGDKVLLSNGFRSGAIAEYILVRDSPSIAVRPDILDAERAAALPLAGLTAITAVDAAQLHPGMSVLTVGASGGVGSFVVQFAVRAGAKVLATGRPEDRAFLRGLGAGQVIDYHAAGVSEQVTGLMPGGVDVAIDFVNYGPALADVAAAVKAGGRVVSGLDGPVSFDRGVTAENVQTKNPEGRLRDLAEQAADGRLQVEIGARYPFVDNSRQALTDFAGKHTAGKVVIIF